MPTPTTKSLDALATYYDIQRGPKEITLRCKKCRKGWAMTPEKAESFNPLGLFDHAYSHEPQDDSDDDE
jgi:hypothetical protein